VWKTLLERTQELGAKWSVYTALGSFVLYFLGYLVLRFQLSTWGVVTDLAVLDERYFFAGARFLAYFVATLASALLLASPFVLAWWLLKKWSRFLAWRGSWNYALLGVVFAVLFIQLVERKCFQVMNSVLLRRQLQCDDWLKGVLLDPSSNSEALFFIGLTIGAAATAWFLIRASLQTPRRATLEGVLAFLLCAEFLLLPVNYGVIVATRQLPRVTQFAPQEAWLVWEGKDKTTFLVEDKERKLVSIPNGDVKKLEIVGVDQIFHRLFAENGQRSKVKP
jgi:hypothetical protein